MSARTIADRLRDEYFSLLPHIRDVAEELEAEVRYPLIPFTQGRERHERIALGIIQRRELLFDDRTAYLRRRITEAVCDDRFDRGRELPVSSFVHRRNA